MSIKVRELNSREIRNIEKEGKPSFISAKGLLLWETNEYFKDRVGDSLCLVDCYGRYNNNSRGEFLTDSSLGSRNGTENRVVYKQNGTWFKAF